jgi:hypothetical protein
MQLGVWFQCGRYLIWLHMCRCLSPFLVNADCSLHSEPQQCCQHGSRHAVRSFVMRSSRHHQGNPGARWSALDAAKAAQQRQKPRRWSVAQKADAGQNLTVQFQLPRPSPQSTINPTTVALQDSHPTTVCPQDRTPHTSRTHKPISLTIFV